MHIVSLSLTSIATLLLLFASCSQNETHSNDGFHPSKAPTTIPLNLKEGYVTNQLTGTRIVPLIGPSGTEIITGTLILVHPKIIHPDSVLIPKEVITIAPKIINANTNLFSVALSTSKIPNHPSTSRINDNTPPSVDPQPGIIRDSVQFIAYPQPLQAPASTPRMKDAASYNIQYLDVDEGMNSSYVMCALEDKRGNLWFGTWGGGVSCYNGHYFQHFTDQEGLSNNFIRSILEAENGDLWFGTNGAGLTRYDGSKFKHYLPKDGLIHPTVYCMFEDSRGHIWIGTGGGLSRYDGHGFSNFTKKNGLSHDDVRCIMEDQNGTLWIGTANGGVSLFDGSTFTSYPQNHQLNDSIIISLHQATNGSRWFAGAKGGITQFDGQRFNYYSSKNGFTDKLVKSIIDDHTGAIWFATDGDGVIRYDRGSFTKYMEPEGLSHNRVYSLLEDNGGNIWCGTLGGGVSFIGRTPFRHFTESAGLSNRKVRHIYEDTSGNLWFATEGGGVSRFDGTSFQHLTKAEGLPDQTIRYILEDKHKNFWFATFGYGVAYYNGKSIIHYTQKEGLSDDFILSMFEDKHGNMWFGTARGGLTCFDGVKFSHYTTDQGMSNNTVWTIFEDTSGLLWFGTDGGGVTQFDGKHFIHYTEKQGLGHNKVRSILEDTQGNLWFGTEGGGISLLKDSVFTYYTEKDGLSNNIIWNLLQDHHENIWVGTEKGLNLLLLKDSPLALPDIITFDNNDGLVAKDFGNHSALIDSKKRAWWGTGKSLVMLDLNTFAIPTLPPKITLTQIEVNEQLYDFHTWPENVNSDLSFDSVNKYSNIPQGMKLSHKKNHLRFQFNALDWAAPHKIKYTYQLSGLSDDWSIPSHESYADYRNLEPGTYTLNVAAKGVAQKWSDPISYSFTIRPPWWQTWWAYALYVLSFLAALRSFSKWRERNLRSENENLEVKVNQRTIELKGALDHLNSTQTQLIHSAKMASLGQLTAGIAHEIQNPLNFVNNFSDVNRELLSEMKDEMAKGNLDIAEEMANDAISNEEKIIHHGKRADAIVKSMLQHSRTSAGVKESTDINVLADEYLRLAHHGLGAKEKGINIVIKKDFDESIGKINVIPQDIGRVILNLTTNAFYAVSEKAKAHFTAYEPTVIVSTKNLIPSLSGKSGPWVEIQISDNGPGISDSIKDKIFQPFFTTKPTGQGTGLGLSLSYDIVKAHGGELSVESTEGEGAAFIIQLPVEKST